MVVILLKNLWEKNQKIYFIVSFSSHLCSDVYLQLKGDITLATHFSGGMLPFSWVSSKPYLFSTYYSPRLWIEMAEPKGSAFEWGKNIVKE